jgi:uncharacterized protein (DUF1697 family)
MALIVFLKGINVGGHRRFKPTVIAKQMKHLNIVNIGAAGTFVVRQRVSRANLRVEIMRRLPFNVDIFICTGSEILQLISKDPFGGDTFGQDIAPFVSIAAKRRIILPALPLNLPADADWCLKVLSCQGRFVVGLHRREMKAITCLGQLGKLLGVALTTRNWNTILDIGRILRG